MSLIVFVSGKGAPGTTSSLLGIASLWRKPVIILEADSNPASGLAPGLFRGNPSSLPALQGLIETWRTNGDVRDALSAALEPIDDGAVSVLLGGPNRLGRSELPSFHQAVLEACLAKAGETQADVFVDVGRIQWPEDVNVFIDAADVVAVVTRSTLPAVAAAKAAWDVVLAAQQGDSPPFGYLCVIGEGYPHSADDIAGLLRITDYDSIHLDPVRAETYSLGTPGPADMARSPYGQSLCRAALSVATVLEQGVRELQVIPVQV